MSNLLDDELEGKIAEEQLENVRMLALVFLAKCLADLFFRLQTEAFIIDVNYVWWILIGMQVVAVQRALYAFYVWKDKRLVQYLRFFYIGIALLLITIALLYGEVVEDSIYYYYLYEVVLILLDTAIALLLIRYYFNRKENASYWLFMEHLLLFCFVVLLLYKGVIFVMYNFAAGITLDNMKLFLQMPSFFKGLLVAAAFWCWLKAVKRVQPQNRVLTLLSLLAVVCWELGLHFEYESRLFLELLLFAGTTLAVLAYASSFNNSSSKK